MEAIVGSLKIFVAAIAMVLGSLAHAQGLSCDEVYVTKTGDNLSTIARRAYGRPTAYQSIFDYNPGVLKSPSSVPVGIELYIPCIEGGNPTPTLDQIIVPKSSDTKILTGSEYPPYVDAGLPEGGFSHELFNRAMQYQSGGTNYKIDVINDWGSHLSPLLSDGAYDLAFSWFKPDCSQSAKLGESSQWRCNNLRFSETLHEVVVTFYASAGSADSIRTPSDAKGMKICRPRGYFTHDLEVMGLVPPAVVRVAGANPTDCFERLASGEVDLVTVNADTSDRVVTELGIRDKVAEVINLATVQTLHAVGMKSNPRTRVLMLRLNKGLIGLRDNGIFRALAGKHL
jgi:polar amino acid transport system substrate-binding protein